MLRGQLYFQIVHLSNSNVFFLQIPQILENFKLDSLLNDSKVAPLSSKFLDRGLIGRYNLEPDVLWVQCWDSGRFDLLPGGNGSFAGVLNMFCGSSELQLGDPAPVG